MEQGKMVYTPQIVCSQDELLSADKKKEVVIYLQGSLREELIRNVQKEQDKQKWNKAGMVSAGLLLLEAVALPEIVPIMIPLMGGAFFGMGSLLQRKLKNYRLFFYQQSGQGLEIGLVRNNYRCEIDSIANAEFDLFLDACPKCGHPIKKEEAMCSCPACGRKLSRICKINQKTVKKHMPKR